MSYRNFRRRVKCLHTGMLTAAALMAQFFISGRVGADMLVVASKIEPVQKIIVVAALNRDQIADGETDCFSFFPKRGNIFGADHSSDKALIPAADMALSPLHYREGCAHILSFNIIKGHIGAVQYGGHTAEVLMSFDLCASKQDGAINAEHCTSKNIYLLRSDLSPEAAFKIGVRAFAQKQHEEWTVMTMALD